MSHRYGNVFLKSLIEKDEYVKLLREIETLIDNGELNDLTEKNIKNLFRSCYELDENILNNAGEVSPQYKLKSVDEIFKILGHKVK